MEFQQSAMPQRSMSSHETAANQESLLLNIPVEIVKDICDILEWAEKVVLSQTCRDLWYLLRPECRSTIRNLKSYPRQKLIFNLSGLLPARYYCNDCYALHLLSPKDAPSPGPGRYWLDIYRSEKCPLKYWKNPLDPQSSTLCGIAFRHVAVAVKCAQRGGIYEALAKKLTQGFTTDVSSNPFLHRKLSVEPRIVNGSFLVRFVHRFEKVGERLSCEDIANSRAIFCPHQFLAPPCEVHYPPPSGDDQGHDYTWPRLHPQYKKCCLRDHHMPVRIAIRQVFKDLNDTIPSRRKFLSCKECATDFKIVISTKKATISVYHDLGDGTSEWYGHWPRHLNTYACFSSFNYWHGSIAARYEKDLLTPPAKDYTSDDLDLSHLHI